MASPLKICVTGAAGQIAYSLLYSIAKGDVFGKDQPLILTLLDIQPMLGALDGVVMELQDCAFPLLKETVPTADEKVAFTGIDVAILVGAFPRKQGMERKDLLKANAKIFESQGKSLNQYAKKSVKVLVVGNPANTNCCIAKHFASTIPDKNFSCLTRLDQNRASAQVAARLNVTPLSVRNITIWGNHSSTQYPDVRHATVSLDGGVTYKPVIDAVKDDNWINGDFIKIVQKRGGAVIAARKLSSAMSAANAICDHMRNWCFGTPEGQWVSMGVVSDGSSYGIPEGIVYSMPVTVKDGEWHLVTGLTIDDFSRDKMDLTAQELLEEKESAFSFLSA